MKIKTDQVVSNAAVSHQLIVDHLHGLQLPLVVVLEHEVVVPAVAVKNRAELIRLRPRDVVQLGDDLLSELDHLLRDFRTIRSEFGHDGRAALEHLGHHGLDEIKRFVLLLNFEKISNDLTYQTE